MFKKIFSLFISFTIILGFMVSNSIDSYAYTQQKVEQSINENAKLMYNSIPNPNFGSIGGEWTILGLARSGVAIPKDYYDNYYARVEQKLKECDGKLHKAKYTEYSRLILALTAMNKDVTNVAGYNLLEYLSDFNNVKRQGINGPIFALIAFDSKNYQIPVKSDASIQTTRQVLIDYILDLEIKKGQEDAGGWALMGDKADTDITFMALQALSNYTNQPKVKAAVDRALNQMSKKQLPTGGFPSGSLYNLESTAQAVVALTALGINVNSDARFIKTDSNGNKKTVIDGLFNFYCKGGGFEHIEANGINSMATDQGMYAMIAYNRYLTGKNKLYNMTDAATSFVTSGETEGGKDEDNKGEDSKGEDKTNGNLNQNGSLNQGNSSDKNTLNKVKTTKNKEATISIKTIYNGEKDGLIPENKKCIVVEFKEKDKQKQSIVRFRLNEEERQDLYYSQELTDLSKNATYIGLIDTSVSNENLLKVENYEFYEIKDQENDSDKEDDILPNKGEIDYDNPERYEIIFGDVNSDGIINAQDILDVQSILSGKLDLVEEKQIIAINVSMDSRIDNGDITQIMEHFISKNDYTIFKLWNSEAMDKLTIENQDNSKTDILKEEEVEDK